MSRLVLTPLVQAPAQTPPPMMLGTVAYTHVGTFRTDYLLCEDGEMLLDEDGNPFIQES